MFSKHLKMLVILTLTSFVLISCSSQTKDDIADIKKELSELTTAHNVLFESHNSLVGEYNLLLEAHNELMAEVICLEFEVDSMYPSTLTYQGGGTSFPCSNSMALLFMDKPVYNSPKYSLGDKAFLVAERKKLRQFKFLCEQRVRPYLPKEFVDTYVGCQPDIDDAINKYVR